MENIKLYFVNTNKYTLEEIENFDFITEDDINRAYKYKKDINKKEHLLSSYFKNKYINDNIYVNEHNKPLTNKTYFNISHSYGYVIFGISNNYDIGVDIELIRDTKDDLIKYISNNDELNYVKDEISFYEIWTSKESLVKCIGTGLIDKVNNIPGLPINGLFNYHNNNYYRKNIISNDYVISITLSDNKDFNIDFINEFNL